MSGVDERLERMQSGSKSIHSGNHRAIFGSDGKMSDDDRNIVSGVVECDGENLQTPLDSFYEYAILHPEQRFWQALRNWCGANFIYISDEYMDDEDLKDTFYIKDEDIK